MNEWFINQLDKGDFKMLKRQHIEYELAKLKKNIYNIEQEMFRAFTDMQDDINELNKFIRSTYGLGDNEDEKGS